MVDFGPLITLPRAREILLPHISHLNTSLAQAFSACRSVPGQLHSALSDSTRASMLNDVFYETVRSELSGDSGFTFRQNGNQKFLFLDDGDTPSIVRFKLLDKNLMSSNFPTRTSLNWTAQRPIPGIPTGVRLTYGYRLDILGVRIDDVFVVLPIGGHVVNDWVWQVWGNPIQTETFGVQSRLNTGTQILYAHDDLAVNQ